jgi:prepilin-type N-terminal cleavage/methylation domain-containing protein
MRFMLKKMKKNEKGFSLVEVLFALLVLTVGITSILFIMVRNIRNSIEAKDQIIAAELVQEGMELVRNLNDNKFLINGTAYPNMRVDVTESGGGSVITFVEAGTDWRLFIVSGAYAHSGGSAGTETKFSRRIDVFDDSATSQRTIRSRVSWNGLGTIPVNCNIANQCASADSIIPY